jgi:hypothetical protein
MKFRNSSNCGVGGSASCQQLGFVPSCAPLYIQPAPRNAAALVVACSEVRFQHRWELLRSSWEVWLTSVGVVVSGSGRAGCKAEASCWTCCTGVVVVRCGCGCGLEFSLATCARTQPPARSDSSGCVLCTWVRPVVSRLAFMRGE